MGQQIINNGDTGLQVRTKLNDNFTELYTGKDSVTVNTFADLPDPTTVPQQKYWVLTSTGVFLINRKSRGCYYSDGVAWSYLGEFPTTADQVGNVPAGNIAATNVQAAIDELDTEKLPTSHAGTGGAAHANVVASGSAGFMTGTDKAKLDGIAAGATANSPDATLLNRANHTGTQAIATIQAAATARIFGRNTAGAGAGEELTAAQVRTMINVADGATANSPDATLLNRANHTGTQAIATVLAAATARFFGRITAGSGAGEELTGTQATTLLDLFTSALKGLVPASGGGTVNFLRADGSWAAPPGTGGGITDGDKGDISVASGGTVWTIDAGSVTFAKMQNLSAPKVIMGRATAGAGSPEELQITGNLELIGTDLEAFVDIGRRPLLAYQAEGATTTISAFGGAALTATGTTTASGAIATTNDYTSTRVLEYLGTTALTTAVAGFRYGVNKWFLGNVANRGGFRMSCTFAPATGVGTTTNRCFVGVSNNTAAPTDVEPSSLLNMIGVGWDAADTNIQIMRNDDAGTATKIDLGASFPVPTADRTKVYTLELYAAPNSASVTYRFWDQAAPGTIATGTLSTDLPAVNTLLSPRGYMSVGGTSSVIGLALSRLVIQG